MTDRPDFSRPYWSTKRNAICCGHCDGELVTVYPYSDRGVGLCCYFCHGDINMTRLIEIENEHNVNCPHDGIRRIDPQQVTLVHCEMDGGIMQPAGEGNFIVCRVCGDRHEVKDIKKYAEAAAKDLYIPAPGPQASIP